MDTDIIGITFGDIHVNTTIGALMRSPRVPNIYKNDKLRELIIDHMVGAYKCFYLAEDEANTLRNINSKIKRLMLSIEDFSMPRNAKFMLCRSQFKLQRDDLSLMIHSKIFKENYTATERRVIQEYVQNRAFYEKICLYGGSGGSSIRYDMAMVYTNVVCDQRSNEFSLKLIQDEINNMMGAC